MQNIIMEAVRLVEGSALKALGCKKLHGFDSCCFRFMDISPEDAEFEYFHNKEANTLMVRHRDTGAYAVMNVVTGEMIEEGPFIERPNPKGSDGSPSPN